MDEPKHIASNLARNLVALRHARGLTQDAVAKSAGVPRSTIANLESGEGNPSLTVLLKVAGALGVPIDELLGSPRARVRKWSRADVPAQAGGSPGVRLRPLVPERVPEEMLTVMEFAAAGTLRGTPHLPGTLEYFTSLEGRVVIYVAGERYDLSSGDVLAFPGNVPHSYQNGDAKRDALGVSVVILAKTRL